MIIMEYELKNCNKIVTDEREGGKINGLEQLIPSIENLQKNNGDYKFKAFNNGIRCEIVVKARDVVSVKIIFV